MSRDTAREVNRLPACPRRWTWRLRARSSPRATASSEVAPILTQTQASSRARLLLERRSSFRSRFRLELAETRM